MRDWSSDVCSSDLDVHQQFVQAVAKGRGLSVSEVKEIADGRIMTGQQALKLKLIDEIGGLEKTLELLAKKIGVEGRPKVIEEKEKTPFFDWLLQSSLPSRLAATLMPASLDRKSTRLNSSHALISYAVFCLKKKIGRAHVDSSHPVRHHSRPTA